MDSGIDRYNQFRKTRLLQAGTDVNYAFSGSDQAISQISNSNDIARDKINSDFLSKLSAIDRATSPQVSESSASLNPEAMPDQVMGGVINGGTVTQAFGNYNPGIYRKYGINSSGRNTGTDISAPEGTPIGLPPGNWEVLDAFDRAISGGLGNKTNKGYGNSVLVRNPETGETLRFSHLKDVKIQPGKVYSGGSLLGTVGKTGNVTGVHLDLEYKNASGQLADVLKTPYARNLFGG
jgi:murein DD-endopeptidase MepM/ murein hydrolase activator NlpD